MSLLRLTADIVVAKARLDSMTVEALLQLIETVYHTLANMEAATAEQPRPPQALVRETVFPDHIVCLEDGMKLKMLTRHLITHYNLTPQQYRHKWGLPADYPMIAPEYAARRSLMAKATGLGRKPVAISRRARTPAATHGQ